MNKHERESGGVVVRCKFCDKRTLESNMLQIGECKICRECYRDYLYLKRSILRYENIAFAGNRG